MYTSLSVEVLTQKATIEGTFLAVFPSESPTTSAAKQSESTGLPPSEETQKPPFGCGCGKCTFFSFIERGCPTPLPSASSFPYLDLSGLTHEQQQELRGRLRFESQEIMMQFQGLVSATILSFKEQCIPPDELVSHVLTLGAFDPVYKQPQVPMFHHCLQYLKAADSVSKIFLILADYFSFFNYHVIEHLILSVGTEKDKANLQKYKDCFDRYAKRRIFQCSPEFGPVSDTYHTDVFVKVDSQYENYTVIEVERFRCQLSKILHISSQGILRLCRVEKGCIQLTFQVPLFVQQEIFPLSREQEMALKAEGVIKLACGEYNFPDDGKSAEKLPHDTDVSGKCMHVFTYCLHVSFIIHKSGVLHSLDAASQLTDKRKFDALRRYIHLPFTKMRPLCE